MQKRAKHTEVRLPFFNNKSSKNTCYDGVNISWIMSTGWYYTDNYAVLHNHSLKGTAKDDVITTF
jgi:hypothetical protein